MQCRIRKRVQTKKNLVNSRYFLYNKYTAGEAFLQRQEEKICC